MNVPRTFLLGLDGATWKVLDRMIDQGVMPNLGELKRRGSSGILRSTIPYLTPVAWSSVITGVRPSKHGIYGYNVMENREGMIAGLLADRSWIQTPTVFDIYGQLGKKVISLNMPMTYPPRPDDGVIITGMMTPSTESTYFYPADLMSELRGQGIDYRIDIGVARETQAELEVRMRQYLSDGARAFFDDLRHVSEEREKAVLYLMDSKDWDLFQVNFISMDRIQHYLWDHIFEGAGDPEVRGRIRDHCSYVDSVIGRIVSRLGDGAMLVICSDHGFGDVKGNFHLDVWLEQAGYYVRKRRGLRPMAMLKRIARSLGLADRLRAVALRAKHTPAKKLVYLGASDVYWGKTRAYVYSTSGIRVNLKGRDQYGIVERDRFGPLLDEIGRKIMETTDSAGQTIFKAVHVATELYGTTELVNAPDLFFEFDDDHFYSTYSSVAKAPGFLDEGYWWRQGDHRRDGVVLLAGSGVAPGKSISADIEDVLPTILYAQRLPLSRTFDGRAIEDAFTPEFNASRGDLDRRVFHRGQVAPGETPDGEEVIDRLKGLGYI
jgi:predicted AlkP superfamily phosphohydrolase/phosphomutase